MQRNVDLNFPQYAGAENSRDSCPVQVAELNWGGELPDGVPHEPETILAADCVYFEVGVSDSLARWLLLTLKIPQPAFPLLVDTLCRLAPIGAPREILFCWKKRRKVCHLLVAMS